MAGEHSSQGAETVQRDTLTPKIESVQVFSDKGDEISQIKYGQTVSIVVKTRDALKCKLAIVAKNADWTAIQLLQADKIEEKISEKHTCEGVQLAFKAERAWIKESEKEKKVVFTALLFKKTTFYAQNDVESKASEALDSLDTDEVEVLPVIVVIDPGHGVKGMKNGKKMAWMDGGAVKLKDPNGKSYGTNLEHKESDITLDVSQKMKTHLEDNADVFLTREGEIDLLSQTVLDQHALNFRWKLANNKNADILVSIHCNNSTDTTASGFEVLYDADTERNKKLAEAITSEQKLVTLRTPAHRKQTLTALSGFTNDAVLVEMGFLSNDDDREVMTTQSDDMAKEIVAGIKKFIKENLK